MSENSPKLLDHYALMWRMRAFELSCQSGVGTREIHGELHLAVGQESISSALAPHLRKSDGLVSTHRNHLHGLAKGVPPTSLMAEIFEKETGVCQGRGGHMHPFSKEWNFSATGIVGASLPVALGYAYAAAMERSDAVGIGVTGDGGANHGTFHEVMNMAGAWSLPLIVLVENNSFAISVRSDSVTAPVAHWQRASAYGALGLSVDAVDVEAVDQTFDRAFSHARSGQGPVVVEAFTHRFRGHYEGDADTYRPREERARIRKECDAILTARAKLIERGVPEADLKRIEQDAKAEMAAVLEEVRATAMPDAAGALDYVFAGAEFDR